MREKPKYLVRYIAEVDTWVGIENLENTEELVEELEEKKRWLRENMKTFFFIFFYKKEGMSYVISHW